MNHWTQLTLTRRGPRGGRRDSTPKGVRSPRVNVSISLTQDQLLAKIAHDRGRSRNELSARRLTPTSATRSEDRRAHGPGACRGPRDRVLEHGVGDRGIPDRGGVRCGTRFLLARPCSPFCGWLCRRSRGRTELEAVAAAALQGPWAGVPEYDDPRQRGLQCYREAGELAARFDPTDDKDPRGEHSATLIFKGAQVTAQAAAFARDVLTKAQDS